MPRGRGAKGLTPEEVFLYFIFGGIVFAFAIVIFVKVVQFLLLLAAGIILGLAALVVLYGIYRLVKYFMTKRKEPKSREG